MSQVPLVSEELLRRYDVAGPRYTSYPTAPIWSDAFGPDHYARTLERAGAEKPDAPLSVYIHIPFCWHMCTYCGCNVVVTSKPERADAYLDLLEREVAMVAERLGARRTVNQMHLGGGTPTFLNHGQMTRLRGIIDRYFTFAEGAELSIEVNPSKSDLAQLTGLRQLGFNRLSLGVQDFDDRVQEAIERVQSYEVTRDFVETARALGFFSVNFDLIYGLPRQTEATWERTMRQVAELAPDRIATYSFAYLPELKTHQRKLPAHELPRGLDKLNLFRQAWGILAESGYQPIGMDHFAAPHDTLATAAQRGDLWRNFQGYTVRSASDTIAFGVTGISDIHGAYAQNVRTLKAYAESIEAGRLPITRGMSLSTEDKRLRHMITHFMCNLHTQLGPDGEARYGEALAPLVADGMCTLDNGLLEVTPLGRIFLRNIAMVFDAYLDPEGEQRFSRTV
jgi:oxygen-independent coproporphyrinogen III oxidase